MTKILLSLIFSIGFLYIASISISPDYFSHISFLDGAGENNVTDVDFGNISLWDDDLEEEEEKEDEQQHQIEAKEWEAEN